MAFQISYPTCSPKKRLRPTPPTTHQSLHLGMGQVVEARDLDDVRALRVYTPSTPYTGSVDGSASEHDCLRLRRALHSLRLNLQTTDREVIELLEEWQDCLERVEKAEKKRARLCNEVETITSDIDWHRHKADDLFQSISSKLSSTAHSVHLQTAPFVQIEHQQALALQCWQLHGRWWRLVRIAIGNGQLVITRTSRSMFGSQSTLAFELEAIEVARADGEVTTSSGCCSSQARWQWTCLLSAAGRDRWKMSQLVFSCDTEAAMHFWPREIYSARAAKAAYPPSPGYGHSSGGYDGYGGYGGYGGAHGSGLGGRSSHMPLPLMANPLATPQQKGPDRALHGSQEAGRAASQGRGRWSRRWRQAPTGGKGRAGNGVDDDVLFGPYADVPGRWPTGNPRLDPLSEAVGPAGVRVGGAYGTGGGWRGRGRRGVPAPDADARLGAEPPLSPLGRDLDLSPLGRGPPLSPLGRDLDLSPLGLDLDLEPVPMAVSDAAGDAIVLPMAAESPAVDFIGRPPPLSLSDGALPVSGGSSPLAMGVPPPMDGLLPPGGAFALTPISALAPADRPPPPGHVPCSLPANGSPPGPGSLPGALPPPLPLSPTGSGSYFGADAGGYDVVSPGLAPATPPAGGMGGDRDAALPQLPLPRASAPPPVGRRPAASFSGHGPPPGLRATPSGSRTATGPRPPPPPPRPSPGSNVGARAAALEAQQQQQQQQYHPAYATASGPLASSAAARTSRLPPSPSGPSPRTSSPRTGPPPRLAPPARRTSGLSSTRMPPPRPRSTPIPPTSRV